MSPFHTRLDMPMRTLDPCRRSRRRAGRPAYALWTLACTAALAAGCAVRQPAPVSERPLPPRQATQAPAPKKPPAPAPQRVVEPAGERTPFYTVQPGDTLFGIATAHGLDHRTLGIWNGIDNPNALKVGMQLRLTPPPWASASVPSAPPAGTVADPASASVAPLRSAPDEVEARPLPGSAQVAAPAAKDLVVSEPRGVRVPYSDQALAQLSRPAAAAPPREASAPPKPPSGAAGPVIAHAPAASAGARAGWVWPASGKLITTFEANANRGIDIGGKLGQPVVASAAGRVIFSGTMRGLGKVIVIQHADELISVYAHNNELLVKQGQEVSRGQKIAEMGASDAEQAKLHFQIRRRGNPNPIDPLSILPERAG